MNIYEKLLFVQSRLKAPKNQYNKFGNYNYRNCEDILEAVKPLLNEVKAVLTIKDEVVTIGDRFYIKAIASFINAENGESIENVALAREEDAKKGMDASQVTGSTSSYARKYALNGLFAIDDTKDSDATNGIEKVEKKPVEKPMTLEEARQMKVTSKGKEYVVATMTDEQLKAMVGFEKMPKLAKACAMELEARQKAKNE